MGGGHERGDGKTLEFALQLVRGAECELAHLGERLDARPAGRAFGDDENTDRLDRTVSALGRVVGPARESSPCGFDSVERVGLAAVASGLAVLAVDFDDVDPCSGEVTGDAGPIGPRPLYTDLADLPEGFEPGQKIRVTLGIGPERLGAEQATDLVQDGGHMDLSVGVDATGDSARGFYDGHAIPSFP